MDKEKKQIEKDMEKKEMEKNEKEKDKDTSVIRQQSKLLTVLVILMFYVMYQIQVSYQCNTDQLMILFSDLRQFKESLKSNNGVKYYKL